MKCKFFLHFYEKLFSRCTLLNFQIWIIFYCCGILYGYLCKVFKNLSVQIESKSIVMKQFFNYILSSSTISVRFENVGE